MKPLALLLLAACTNAAAPSQAPPAPAAYRALIASDALNSSLVHLFANGGRAVVYMVVVDSLTAPQIIVQITKQEPTP